MKSCTFTNDNNVSILLLDHPFSESLKNRDNHEVLFRKINTFLITNKIIKNNIIDLGAWIGDNSLPWAKNIDGIVYAIDPSQENCEYIAKMSELNQIENIKIIQTAISHTNELLSTNDNINHCTFVFENTGINGNIKVGAVSLDYLYDKQSIENIGYIHLDVEGMEYRVMKGSSNLIDSCRPIISFEQHLDIEDYNIILSYLTDKQYSVYLIDEILPGCRYDCRNSLAFPNEICNEELILQINDFIGKDILIQK